MPETREVVSMEGWPDAALAMVIDVARAQLDAQLATLDRVLSRTQLLFTTLLALIAVALSSWPTLWASNQGVASRDTATEVVVNALLVLSLGVLLVALLGASAIIAVKKKYDGMSAMVLAEWSEYDQLKLARQYTESVSVGQATTDAHLTVFGTAVRITLGGATVLAIAWLVFFATQ